MSLSPDDPPKRIGIAVVEHLGRFLVGVRPPGSDLAGCAEFPGGKCAPGEGTGQCACRECLEETGLEVFAVELLMQRVFRYPHGAFELHFWHCRPRPQAVILDDHRGFRWVPRGELATLTFPEGNTPVVELLSRG